MKLLLIFCTLAELVRAESLDERVLRQLTLHTSAHAIEKLMAQSQSLTKSRKACHVQLRERIVPSECYRALESEYQSGLHSPNQRRRVLRELDEACRRAARSSVSEEDPNIPRINRAMSPACRGHLESLRRTLAYRFDKGWSEN